jgi:hypothetical protein
MGILDFLFGKNPVPAELRPEVNKLIEELVKIGQLEDFLSERPGGAFNGQCRHIRARQIGERLNKIGGFVLMEQVHKKIRKSLGPQPGTHLSYSWADIGKWVA